MKTFQPRFFLVPLFVLMVFAVGQSAFATPMTLTLTSGTNTVTISDEGLGDSLTLVGGAVGYIGRIGNFDVVVNWGLSKPFTPNTPTFAEMVLNMVATSSGSGGTLTATLTDYDFLATGPGTLTGNIGGTTQGSISAAAWKNENVALIGLGPYSTPSFSDSASNSHGALGMYSMTLTASITHGASGTATQTSSFDFDVQNTGRTAVPEPATLVLLGAGLLGLGFGARRQSRT